MKTNTLLPRCTNDQRHPHSLEGRSITISDGEIQQMQLKVVVCESIASSCSHCTLIARLAGIDLHYSSFVVPTRDGKEQNRVQLGTLTLAAMRADRHCMVQRRLDENRPLSSLSNSASMHLFAARLPEVFDHRRACAGLCLPSNALSALLLGLSTTRVSMSPCDGVLSARM